MMQCKFATIDLDSQVVSSLIRGIDDSVNGEENRKIEEHLNNIRELSGRTKGKA